MDKKILINTFWLSAEKFIRLPLSFLINIYLIKHLGAEEYGSYVFYLVVIGLLLPLSSFGMDAFLVKQSVAAPANAQSKIFLNGLIVRLMGSVAGFLIAVTIVLTDESELSSLGLLMCFVLLIESFTVGQYRLLATEKAFKISVIELLAFFMGFIAKCAFLIFDLPIIYLGIAYCLDFFTRSLCFFFFSSEDLFKTKTAFDLTIIKRYISIGKKLVVIGLLVAALTKIDQVMIYFILGDKSIGIYSASLRFIEPLLLIIVVFNEVAFPRLLYFQQVGKQEYRAFVRRLLLFNSCGALLIYIIVSLLAPAVIVYMLGDEFIIAAEIYPILALLIPVLSLVLFLDKYLQAENIHNLNRDRIVVSFIINIPLNYFLIGFYGLNGAAVATIVSYLLGLLVVFLSPQFREKFTRVMA
ncbi:MAG: O-antigen/teichoic acid export membrane protein [Oceanospirillaceae bacterium]|jgi:O-antigen/teichoic acid export membrane protein